MTAYTRPNVDRWGNLIELLVKGNVSRISVRQATGFSTRFITEIFSTLERRGIIHFSGYGQDKAGREQVELFTLGPAPADAPQRRPPAGKKKKPPVKTSWKGIDPSIWSSMVNQPKTTRRRPLVAIPQAVREVAAAE